MPTVGTLLNQIESGSVLLPVFQRGYVWNRNDVRALWQSLYRRFPIGSLLFWETERGTNAVRGGDAAVSGNRLLLLDGQQRLTSLYGVVRGEPPAFFDADPRLLSGLHFHLDREMFQYYSAGPMRSDDHWIDIGRLFECGAADTLTDLKISREQMARYMQRLGRITQVLDRELPEEKLTGMDQDVETVVEIFNKINSGGRQLTKGDLAVARIGVQVPTVRQSLRDKVELLKANDCSFTIDRLLRATAAVATGSANLDQLADIDSTAFEYTMRVTFEYLSTFRRILAERLGLDHDRILFGKATWPVICKLLDENNGGFTDPNTERKVLLWYVHAHLSGRYGTSAQTMLGRDLRVAEQDGIDGLITELENWTEQPLEVRPDHFEGNGTRSKAFPLLHIFAHHHQTDLNARPDRTSNGNQAERRALTSIHTIVPRQDWINAGNSAHHTTSPAETPANLTLVSPETKAALHDRHPSDYLPDLERHAPHTLRAHAIPNDPRLWEPQAHKELLEQRAVLLSSSLDQILL